MGYNAILDKSRSFSIRIIKLAVYLRETKRGNETTGQLIRSGTSIGANVVEAHCGISKKDFYAKMYIAFKECAETKFWLDVMHEAGILSDKEFESIFTDCQELYKLLSAITYKTRKNLGIEQ